jgi:hypothetical protein
LEGVVEPLAPWVLRRVAADGTELTYPFSSPLPTLGQQNPLSHFIVLLLDESIVDRCPLLHDLCIRRLESYFIRILFRHDCLERLDDNGGLNPPFRYSMMQNNLHMQVDK